MDKKNMVFALVLGLFMFFSSLPLVRSQESEQLTITTYYPSPAGSYNELGTNKLAVDVGGVAVPSEFAAMQNGDTHIGRSLIVGAGGSGFAYDELTTSPLTDGDVVIKSRVGIGTTTPGTNKLYVNGPTYINGALTVNGALSKTSGSFDILHPDPLKAKQGWHLRHSFVESPTRGDNIYRWLVKIKDGEGVIDLPDYFRYLNENVQVWVSPKGHFGRAYADINQEYTKITVKADADGPYNVLLVGTRKDAYVQEFDKLGVEYQETGEGKL